jgi:multiple sugar transport system substrate-binding protein
MSARSIDTASGAAQFIYAYTAAWPTPTGPNLLNDPAGRTALAKGLAGYTALWTKGCTPPDVLDWANRGNNDAFVAQRVVMTINPTLSIPGALRPARPEDYYRNAITIGWPKDAFGRPEHIDGGYYQAVVFKDGGHTAAAREFVCFLIEDGWLATYLTNTGDRLLPPSKKMLNQPFWLDPLDPHRLQSAVQAMSQPHVWRYYGLNREQGVRLGREGQLWSFSTAVQRIVADGLTPEQAADKAIARIKQLLSE